ncbi:MAG: hypothetical protein LBP51_03915, partial [Deferribacteraceae bacterium]|nr:hypothetical protein [Deferribacteraceae bacterium]
MFNRFIIAAAAVFALIAVFEGVYSIFLAERLAKLRIENTRLQREKNSALNALEVQNLKIESYAEQLERAKKEGEILKQNVQKEAARDRELAVAKLKMEDTCEN